MITSSAFPRCLVLYACFFPLTVSRRFPSPLLPPSLLPPFPLLPGPPGWRLQALQGGDSWKLLINIFSPVHILRDDLLRPEALCSNGVRHIRANPMFKGVLRSSLARRKIDIDDWDGLSTDITHLGEFAAACGMPTSMSRISGNEYSRRTRPMSTRGAR